jgi:hypothetical protein
LWLGYIRFKKGLKIFGLTRAHWPLARRNTNEAQAKN